MLAIGLGAFAHGIGDAQRRDDDLAGGEAREHADGDFPVEAARIEDGLDAFTEAAHPGLLDIGGLDLRIDDLGRYADGGGADALFDRGIAREVGERPHNDSDGEDDRAGPGDELRGILPHTPKDIARLGHLVAG